MCKWYAILHEQHTVYFRGDNASTRRNEPVSEESFSQENSLSYNSDYTSNYLSQRAASLRPETPFFDALSDAYASEDTASNRSSYHSLPQAEDSDDDDDDEGAVWIKKGTKTVPVYDERTKTVTDLHLEQSSDRVDIDRLSFNPSMTMFRGMFDLERILPWAVLSIRPPGAMTEKRREFQNGQLYLTYSPIYLSVKYREGLAEELAAAYYEASNGQPLRPAHGGHTIATSLITISVRTDIISKLP